MMVSRNNRLFYSIAFATVLAIYLLTLSHNQAIAHDGIIYAQKAKEGVWVFHPHHLLYHVFSLLCIKLIHTLGFSLQEHILMSAINSIFGAALITLILKIFIDIYKLRKFYSLVAVGLIAFSYGVWYYSTCVEVYIIPLFFAVLSYYFYLKNPEEILKVSISASLATLFHQTYIFLLFVYLINLIYNRVKLISITKFALQYALFVGVPYILVLFLDYKARSLAEAYYHLTYYAQELPEFWSRIGISMILNDIVGFTRVIFSIHLLLSFSFVQNLIFKYFASHSFKEEIFLIRNITSIDQIFGLTLLFVLVLAFIYFVIISLVNFLKNKEYKSDKVWFISYLLFFGGFFTLWSSNNLEFWISVYVFTIIFLIRLNSFNLNYKFYLITSIFLLLFNFISTTQFVVNPNNDFYQTRINEIKPFINKNSLLVIDKNYMLFDYLRYNDYTNVLKIDEYNENYNSEKVYFVESIFSSKNELSEKYRSTIDNLNSKNLLEKIQLNDYEIFKVKNNN